MEYVCPMSIVITERAATEVKKILDDQKYEEGTFLRVGVTGGGCSGFSYALGFDKEYDQQADSKTDQHGVTVVVDKKSFLYLVGTELRYSGGLNGKGFEFHNPNANRTCGCGESFSL